MTTAFNIPNIDESIKLDYFSGLITLEEAAIEWCEAGSTNFVSLVYAKKKLGIK